MLSSHERAVHERRRSRVRSRAVLAGSLSFSAQEAQLGGGKDSNGYSLMKDDGSGLRRRRGVSPGSSPLVTGSRPNGEVPGLDEWGKQHRSRSVSPFSGLGS